MSNQPAKKLHEEAVKLFRKGHLEEALQKFTNALEAAEDNSRQKAEIYNDLGVVHTQLEDYSAAQDALDQAMRCFQTLEDRKGEAQTLGNQAALYQAEGALDEAVETYKESAQILEELGENDMAMYVWQAISKLRMKQGQYIAAIGAYEEGVDNMPEASFKRKVLRQILKAPNSLLGGSGSAKDTDEEKER